MHSAASYASPGPLISGPGNAPPVSPPILQLNGQLSSFVWTRHGRECAAYLAEMVLASIHAAAGHLDADTLTAARLM